MEKNTQLRESSSSVAFSPYMKKLVSLITLTSLTAMFVAMCAAVFSVTGIATLFAGAALSAGIMASALELGKLVSISFLYQYWEKIPRGLKAYLLTAAVILMLITSAGIYGYLSSAYAKVAATPLQLNADIEATQGRIQTIEQDIERKNQRLNQLIELRSQQETRLDNLVSKSTTGNNTTIRSAQNALNQADKNVTQLQQEITKLANIKDSLNQVSISKNVEIQTNSDIGTFVYIAKAFGVSLDTVVKWFTLIIVLVFDPLAVALVIAVNFLLKQNQSSEENILKKEINNKPSINNDVGDKEPYEVYVTEVPKHEQIIETTQQPQVEPETKPQLSDIPPIGNDPQYFLRGDFDWSKHETWETYRPAVNYYNNYIAPR